MKTPSADSGASFVAVTDEARRALGGASEARIAQFPFNVGRESRSPSRRQQLAIDLEHRAGVAVPVNDLYLMEPDASGLLQISREHCAIERIDTRFFLVDRRSASGTVVAGKQVGGNRSGGRTELRDGDLVVIGNVESRYVFRFQSRTD